MIASIYDIHENVKLNKNWKKRFSVKFWLQPSESSDSNIQTGIQYLR